MEDRPRPDLTRAGNFHDALELRTRDLATAGKQEDREYISYLYLEIPNMALLPDDKSAPLFTTTPVTASSDLIS